MRGREVDREAGQASVELLGSVPLVLAIALALAQVALAGAVATAAGHGAQAGAMAVLQGGDPEAAARAALPGWSRGRVDVAVSGRRVRVRVHPRAILPPLAGALSTTATADAGPAS